MTQKQYDVIRCFSYTIELLLLFMLQQTPWLIPEIFGVRPILLLPAVIMIAMFETNLVSMAFGIFGGLLIDFAGGGSLGFTAILLAVLCFFLSCLCMELIQTNLMTAIAAGAVAIASVFLLYWLVLYVAKGTSYPFYILYRHILPRFGYTYLFTVPLFYLNRLLAVSINPAR